MTPPIDTNFDSEGPTALVCVDDPDVLSIVIEQLGDIGYQVSCGMSPEDMLYKLQGNTYDVLLIAENIGEFTVADNPLLAETRNLHARQRQQQVVVLLGPSVQTSEEGQAFQLSVDHVINSADVSNLGVLVRRAVTRAKEFYGRHIDAIAAADTA